jgi:beta-galactosidase
MFHGGTNFGFTNGANDKGTYRPTLTSYDYDAPLDEAGDPTAKYAAFREVIARHEPVPDEPVPAAAAKLAHGPFPLTEHAGLLGNVQALGTAPVAAAHPLTLEELGESFGFLLLETELSDPGPTVLRIESVHDRAQVFVDGQPVGTLSREEHEHALGFGAPRAGARLTVLVENQGRVNYGRGLRDRKGLLGAVTVNGKEPETWTCRALPLAGPELDGLVFQPAAETAPPVGPAFHRGFFDLSATADTFLALPGWTKGCAWVNGFALGRYWSRGPQRTLYVPAPVLRTGRNEIIVLELHGSLTGAVELRDAPDLGPGSE